MSAEAYTHTSKYHYKYKNMKENTARPNFLLKQYFSATSTVFRKFHMGIAVASLGQKHSCKKVLDTVNLTVG